MTTAFDHAVIMVRDQLDALAPDYAAQGFTLSERSTHNIGSCNQLIVLQDAYLELLGWPPGAPPRAEIAASALGLEALVFRSHDAQATYERLKAAGFAVNPVQDLSRPAKLHDYAGGGAAGGVADTVAIARFLTVRFAEQPIAGLRMYFCQHLTPQCVWQPALMAHPNGARRISHITIAAPDAQELGARLGQIINVAPARGEQTDSVKLALANLELHIHPDATLALPRLSGLTVQDANGAMLPLRITTH